MRRSDIGGAYARPVPTKSKPTRADRMAAFGAAVEGALRAAGMTQVELAETLGIRSQAAVSAWVTGKSVPDQPEDVFAIERALGAKPGSISRHLGYLPPEAVKVAASFEDAIDADPHLNSDDRAFLLNAYRMALRNRGARRGRPRG